MWTQRTVSAGLLFLMAGLPYQRPLVAAPISVHLAEGSLHGAVVLTTSEGTPIASGDFLQVGRGGEVESRLVFHFEDGSLYDESVVFTQQKIFAMQRYHLVRRGPIFPEDIEISLERSSGAYHVRTEDHEDGRVKKLDGTMEFPLDAYNGMIPVALKNLSGGEQERMHLMVFTPAPKAVEMELVPAGEEEITVGGSGKIATHFLLKPVLGFWKTVIGSLLGRVPPDYHVWIVRGDVPEFAGFEGQLYMKGPIWRIEPIRDPPR